MALTAIRGRSTPGYARPSHSPTVGMPNLLLIARAAARQSCLLGNRVEALPQRVTGGRRAGADAELAIDRAHVRVDGTHAEHQLFGYLGVGKAGSDQPEHLHLTHRKPGWMLWRTSSRKVEDLGGAHRPPSCPLRGEPIVAQGAPRAVG